jgi:hypothetical protein
MTLKTMTIEEERIQEVRRALREYAKENEVSAFNIPYYFAKQILPEKSLFLGESHI